VDDFRTLIASGFEFPILHWCPPNQESPSVGSKTVELSKPRTLGKNLESLSQGFRSGVKRIGELRDQSLADQTAPPELSKTANDLNGPLQFDHSRACAERRFAFRHPLYRSANSLHRNDCKSRQPPCHCGCVQHTNHCSIASTPIRTQLAINPQVQIIHANWPAY
jgi:hypothetical protein